jgi:hypothetical protein
MRVADLILSHGVRMPPGVFPGQPDMAEIERTMSDSVRDLILTAPVIVATNVYEYCRTITDELDLYADLPCAAPPFDEVWLEYNQRNGIQVGLEARASNANAGRFIVGQPKPVEVGSNGYTRLSPYPGEPDLGMWLSDNLPDQAAWDQVRWLWTVHFYQSDGRRWVFGPLTTLSAALDEWGALLDLTYQFLVPAGVTDASVLQAMALTPMQIFLTTINLMQCANVRTVYVDPPAALSRKHRRKGHLNRDLVRYGVLQLGWEGPAERSRHRSKPSQGVVGSHIVRGSIHHYGNCCPRRHPPKGLYFGKYEGRIWVPHHDRGNPGRGVIVSDFEIAEHDG